MGITSETITIHFSIRIQNIVKYSNIIDSISKVSHQKKFRFQMSKHHGKILIENL